MRTPLALAALLVAAALAACGDDGGAGGDGDGTDLAAELDGRELVVTGITEDGVGREPVEGTEIRVTFDQGSIGASAGCNSMSGPYTLDGDVLVVEQLATTEMACEPALMDQDEWLADVLTGGPEVVLDGAGVALLAGSTVLQLADREAVRPDAPLVGTVWVLDTIFDGTGPDSAASSVPEGVEASVTFADDGTIAIDTGCNTGSGTYEGAVGEGTPLLVLGEVTVTGMGCDEPSATVEQAVLALFSPGEAAVEIDDQRLTLTSATAALGFRASP